MPFEYFEHLRTIYILDVTFYDRAASFFSFGTVTSFLKNKTIEVSSLEDLSSVLSICYEDFLTFIPEKLLEELHKVKPQRTKPTIAKI